MARKEKDIELIGDFVAEHGSMDIEEHEKTFEAFIRFVTWTTVSIIIVLIILAFVGA